MKVLLVFLVVLGSVLSADQVFGTCYQLRTTYMNPRGHSYAQQYAAEVDNMAFCPNGYTCCNGDIEMTFYKDIDLSFKRLTFLKTVYIKQLEEGRTRIAQYMTEILTLAHSHNTRTRALVDEFLNSTTDQLASLDKLQYPVSSLLDIAESYSVKGLQPNNTDCIAEIKDLLRGLGGLQFDGLYIARLLYQAIPKGVDVMKEMQYQDIPVKCIRQLVKAHRCQLCLDATNVKTCHDYCMDITNMCFKHLEDVSVAWEEYAVLTNKVMSMLDMFAKIYQDGLSSTIRRIRVKLSDRGIAEMCGYDEVSNLARNKRGVPTSMARNVLFDGTFMIGMIGNMGETHCDRTSIDHDRCWNGTAVGPYTFSGTMLIQKGAINATKVLEEKMDVLKEFNEEFRTVYSIKMDAIKDNLNEYNTVTETPAFVCAKPPCEDSSSLHAAPSFLLATVAVMGLLTL